MGGVGFGPHDEQCYRDTLDYSYECGLRHFDTADIYGGAETLLEKSFRDVRSSIFISSKGGLKRIGNRVTHDGSFTYLRGALQRSLERLKTDYLDLYSLHWPDKDTPISESIEALKLFKKEGLIRNWGIGNFSVDQLESFIEEDCGCFHQLHYNPLHKALDLDKVSPVKQLNVSAKRCKTLVYSPFEQGLLCREYESLGKKDVRRRNPYFLSKEARLWAKVYREALVSDGVHLHDVCSRILSWCLNQEGVLGVLVGARNKDQLSACLRILGNEY